MDTQAAPPTYAEMNTGRPPAGNPPVLGQQVPGMTGGLPAQGGLSVTANPMAEQLRSYGRGEDTMLVHMTPAEVNSLQGLAMAHGGSLTINPHTGLPEAGWLGKLLPTLLGVGLNFVLPGSGLVATLGGKAATAGLITALGSTAITGDIKKGLMAGLQAFGGASLAGGIQGAVGGAAKNVASAPVAATRDAVSIGSKFGGGLNVPGVSGFAPGAASSAASGVVQPALQKGLAGFAQGFANTAKGSLPGIISKAAVPAAVMGVANSFSPSSGGGVQTPTGQIDNSYQGPYFAQDRQQIMDPNGPLSSKQRRHFAVSMPEIRNVSGDVVQPGSMTPQGTQILQPVARAKPKKGENMYDFRYVTYMGGPPAPGSDQMNPVTPALGMPGTNPMDMGYAHGGAVNMHDGAFVVDARTVSELGNGSSNAGIEALSRLGGQPVRGPGDGVSDSVPASIGGKQEARVARDEVIFQPEAVKRIGGGSEKRGTQKLYALMDKAHKARKNAKRGQDTGVRRGLA